jgi:hypothetical protein
MKSNGLGGHGMTVYYHDHLGAVMVKINEYGITFDRDRGFAIFEDEDGNAHRIKIFDLELITNE